MLRKSLLSKAIITLGLSITIPAQAIEIEFDYTYDINGFFSDIDRRSLLEQAASFYTSYTDDLTAISPEVGDSWSVQMSNPGLLGSTVTVDNLEIAEDTMRIYVGASSSFSSVLGFASSGLSITASGSQTFVDSVFTRGQDNATGGTASDYGIWGGMIWFNAAQNWYFGSDTNGLDNTSPDFLTTATHEIGHILGFGTADSWAAQINDDGDFIGENSVAAYGDAVPLDQFGAHWAEGTMSTYNGLPQETMMDPSTSFGERQLPTVLDQAAFADIGWQVAAVPEPSTYALLISGLGIMGICRKRKPA